MTLEEIMAKAKDNPALRKQIVLWAKDTDEGKEVLTSFAEADYNSRIKDKVAEIHSSYDNDIFEVLGVRKKSDQKTYDFVKEIAKDLKALKGVKADDKDVKVKELQDKIKELNDSGSVNEHWKKMYDELVLVSKEKEAELSKTISDNNDKFTSDSIMSDLDAGRLGMKFMDGIPVEAIDAMSKSTSDELIKNAKIVDGKVVYHKVDGTPWLNKEYKAISASDIWKEKLEKVIVSDSDGSAGGGSGGVAPKTIKNGSIMITGEGDNAKKKLVLDRATFSTKVEFNKMAEKTLRAQGVSSGDKEFNEMLDGAYKEYEVSEMEIQ